MNPAITLAFALLRRKQFSPKKVPHYMISQLIGSVIAGCVVYALWNPFIVEFERVNNLQRGELGSHKSAMMFGEYFPNPSLNADGNSSTA